MNGLLQNAQSITIMTTIMVNYMFVYLVNCYKLIISTVSSGDALLIQEKGTSLWRFNKKISVNIVLHMDHSQVHNSIAAKLKQFYLQSSLLQFHSLVCFILWYCLDASWCLQAKYLQVQVDTSCVNLLKFSSMWKMLMWVSICNNFNLSIWNCLMHHHVMHSHTLDKCWSWNI